MTPRILIVGESNPWIGRANFVSPLYHLPRGASGDRLRMIMGLRDATYEPIEKVNLCAGRWSIGEARGAAWDLQVKRSGVIVGLGSKVRAAFDGPAPFEAREIIRDLVLVTLPHPSGRNLAWNDPFRWVDARRLLAKHAPWVPWGEVEEAVLRRSPAPAESV